MRKASIHKLAIVLATASICVLLLRLRSPTRAAVPPVVSVTVDGTTLSLAELRAALPHVDANDTFRFDAVAIVRPRADQKRVQEWNEHPDGRIVLRTNNLGLRSNAPTGEATGRRVLLLGDSHTYGLVNNAECLHEQLEARLTGRLGEPFEVLNAGVGGTGPYEYLGSLSAFLPLDPDLVLVVLYTGNDFGNALHLADVAAGRTPAPLPVDAARRMADVREHWSRKRCLAQGLKQAFTFRHRHDAERLAVEATTRCLTAMADLCAAAELPLVVAVLPTKIDVDVGDETLLLTAVRDSLQLTAEDYGINRRMGLAVADALRERGATVVDLHDSMRDERQPLYWRGDHHLAVAGHAHVADELAPILARILAPFSGPTDAEVKSGG